MLLTPDLRKSLGGGTYAPVPPAFKPTYAPSRTTYRPSSYVTEGTVEYLKVDSGVDEGIDDLLVLDPYTLQDRGDAGGEDSVCACWGVYVWMVGISPATWLSAVC